MEVILKNLSTIVGHDGRTRFDLQDGHRSIRRRDLPMTTADIQVTSVGVKTAMATA